MNLGLTAPAPSGYNAARMKLIHASRSLLVAGGSLLLALAAPPASRAGVETALLPEPGKAIVCFYREVAFEGNWPAYRLADGSVALGRLPAESYLVQQVDAGEHDFGLGGLVRRSTLHLRVKPGRLYYLRCVPAAEAVYLPPALELVPIVEGAAVVATLRPGVTAR